ncbi:conserved hypothetical protein [Rippkaea orientalis PCC 8801]|uniref:Transmembrane protein n=1 Tax=Rippkaea orientalis (strain PCC 8801 / RF-1) TaxID=41431 RepID=B7K2J9_RIPO1|nr:hypothetical protein [Rippkaea orientalis]ACK66392.1 conserved hypothetical protein [Rippkaea orientalis PCC 8801]
MEVRQERETRNLALDYAFGVSILGLIPISDLLTLKLLIAIILIIKMLWHLGVKWKFVKGQDILAIAGYWFSWLGAFGMAFMAWLTFLGIGLFVPYVSSFRLAAALFTLTWMLGQSTNQFYAIGQQKLMMRKQLDESEA